MTCDYMKAGKPKRPKIRRVKCHLKARNEAEYFSGISEDSGFSLESSDQQGFRLSELVRMERVVVDLLGLNT